MKDKEINQILEDTEFQPNPQLLKTTTKLRMFLSRFHLLDREAFLVLCGLSNSYTSYTFPNGSQKVIVDSSKIRNMGKSVFQLTKERMFLFGDVQYLSLPWEDLQTAYKQINDDTLIPQFMKSHQLYELVIPFIGVSRLRKSAPNNATKIRNLTCIGSFYLMIGLLVMKYGKDNIVENFIVPKIFNGPSGLISIVTSNL